ncbi:MAG TPA: hypothetical protein VIK83_03380 [Coriobacteriia bacterium]
MAVDIKVIGEFPRADFEKGRQHGLDEVGRIAKAAERAAAPIQRTRPGGHPPGTLREAITTRNMQKGIAIKVGIIGKKSLGWYGRFVESGHAVKVAVGYRLRGSRAGANSKFIGPRRTKTTKTIGHASPHPFFFPTMSRISPALGDTVIDELERSVTMEKVRL